MSALADVYEGIRQLGVILESEDRANRVADSLAGIDQRVSAATQEEILHGTVMPDQSRSPDCRRRERIHE